MGSNETALRCTAIQFLLAGTTRQHVCDALEVTERALRKWIKAYNRCGIDGLIAQKRPGRILILSGQQAQALVALIEAPEQVERTFWTAKGFHGYLSQAYEISCGYRLLASLKTIANFVERIARL